VSSGDHTFGSDRIGTLDAGIPHRSQLQSGQPHDVCCGRAGQVWVSDISPIDDCVSERLTLSGHIPPLPRPTVMQVPAGLYPGPAAALGEPQDGVTKGSSSRRHAGMGIVEPGTGLALIGAGVERHMPRFPAYEAPGGTRPKSVTGTRRLRLRPICY
jgi:hypothetical protein